jgi:hypothetical protein
MLDDVGEQRTTVKGVTERTREDYRILSEPGQPLIRALEARWIEMPWSEREAVVQEQAEKRRERRERLQRIDRLGDDLVTALGDLGLQADSGGPWYQVNLILKSEEDGERLLRFLTRARMPLRIEQSETGGVDDLLEAAGRRRGKPGD